MLGPEVPTVALALFDQMPQLFEVRQHLVVPRLPAAVEWRHVRRDRYCDKLDRLLDLAQE